MKKIISSYILIIIEIIILLLSVLWYFEQKEIEPIIVGITALGGIITAILIRITRRPRLVLHHVRNSTMRLHRGYSPRQANQILQVGIDHPIAFWELKWNYKLEIRNNSSNDAYYVEIEYENLPINTKIAGELGKIEPILANSMKELEIIFRKELEGTHIQADDYLRNNENILTKDFKIVIKYKNEDGLKYKTVFNWVNNEWTLK